MEPDLFVIKMALIGVLIVALVQSVVLSRMWRELKLLRDRYSRPVEASSPPEPQ